jgi:hypothetical protein
MVYTVAGAAVVCVLLTQLLKHYLADWRFTNLLAWGLTLVVVEIAAVAFISGGTLWERAYNAFLMSLAGASLSTFGYEAVVNLLGKAGVGPRSDKAIIERAGAIACARPPDKPALIRGERI